MINEKYLPSAEAFLRENFFTGFLEPEILALDSHYIRAKMKLRHILKNSMGIMHGGAIYSFGDSIVGLACRTDGEKAVTLDGNINYISNISEGAVVAETKLLHQGRRTAVYRVEFTSEEGKLLAEARYTMHIFNTKL